MSMLKVAQSDNTDDCLYFEESRCLYIFPRGAKAFPIVSFGITGRTQMQLTITCRFLITVPLVFVPLPLR